MAEFALRILRGGESPLREDGDIISAFSDLRIAAVNAQHVCKGIYGPVSKEVAGLWNQVTRMGGRTYVTELTVWAAWDGIERLSDFRRTDHLKAYLSDQVLREFLVVDVEDFTEAARHDFQSPLTRPAPTTDNPDARKTVAEKKYRIDWRNSLGLSVLDMEMVVDPKERIDWRHVRRDRHALVIEKEAVLSQL
jgi:hypothetical protein